MPDEAIRNHCLTAAVVCKYTIQGLQAIANDTAGLQRVASSVDSLTDVPEGIRTAVCSALLALQRPQQMQPVTTGLLAVN